VRYQIFALHYEVANQSSNKNNSRD